MESWHVEQHLSGVVPKLCPQGTGIPHNPCVVHYFMLYLSVLLINPVLEGVPALRLVLPFLVMSFLWYLLATLIQYYHGVFPSLPSSYMNSTQSVCGLRLSTSFVPLIIPTLTGVSILWFCYLSSWYLSCGTFPDLCVIFAMAVDPSPSFHVALYLLFFECLLFFAVVSSYLP